MTAAPGEDAALPAAAAAAADVLRRGAASAAGLPPPDPRLRACVVVPARDEADRIGACLRALAAQADVAGAVEVLLVLDGCTDATAAEAEAAAARGALVVHALDGPAAGGPGPARRLGMDAACARLHAVGRPDGLVASTDADTLAEPGWLAAQQRWVAAGDRVVAGRILLDGAGVPEAVLAARAQDAAARLAVARAADPRAEHHQCSGASLGLTAATYAAVGGLPDVLCLEDEALERRLAAAGVPVGRRADVRVRTSARTDGRAQRGLGQALRVAGWHARQAARPPGGLAGPLAEPGVLLVLGVHEDDDDPLTELVARPALNLHVPDLAALRAPLSASVAVAPGVALPPGPFGALRLALALHARHGLEALAEASVQGPAPHRPPATGEDAYAILAAVSAHASRPPVAGTAFVRAARRLTTSRVAVPEPAPAGAPSPSA